MKKKMKLIIVLSCFLLSLPLLAQEISGVKIANNITIDTIPLQLNGAGIRSKFFLNLYVGSLYLPEKSTKVKSILNFPSVAIRLNITSGMITSTRMTDALNKGFNLATNNNTSKINPQIKAFTAFFKKKIKNNDQFTLVANKKNGVAVYKNNKKQGIIIGEAFRVALLNIWLGNNPVQQSLKKELLNI